MGFKICDRGNYMEIVSRDGKTIACYAYYRDPITGHEENHKSAIRKMRMTIRDHIGAGGTLGNYQW